ncbi:MAG TPA: ATP-binding protein [Gemmatimonadaceae bacterium]|nr:ATP-binding protein [Gemmatimonadaceae bacterium]
MATNDELMARLAKHRALGHAPAAEHAWLVAHGELRANEAGIVVNARGQQVTRLLIVLDGHVVIRGDRGAGAHKIFEWKGGDCGGLMPYSRGAAPPHDAVTELPTETLEVSNQFFPELVRECPVVTAALVHAMLDRARQFTSADLRDEKLISLGKLASGLAHELNNPASAVVRSAKMLAENITASEDAARELAAAGLTAEQLAALDDVHKRCLAPRQRVSMSSIARADREDVISDWLAAHGADTAQAASLAETGVTIDALDGLAQHIHDDALDAALRWLAAGCLTRALSDEIETAASRIHSLVGAVKGFSYMDRAPTAEAVDVARGINDSLTMLAGKVRAKAANVELELPLDLPAVHGVGAELNQVWMNLLDNALDAVSNGGNVVVSAVRERERIVVRVVDDGPGIPPDVQQRMFEPFFTTKGVGKGTGLGLDIVRRMLQRNEGDISVTSAPGRTEFQVRLPAES